MMYSEPTTAAEVWARARLIKGRPKAPVVIIPVRALPAPAPKVETKPDDVVISLPALIPLPFTMIPESEIERPHKPTQRDWLRINTPGFAMWTPQKEVSLMQLREAVIAVSGRSFEYFMEPKRSKGQVALRYAFYWLGYKYTKASNTQLARASGRMDHSTVQSAFQSQTLKSPLVLKVIQSVILKLHLPAKTLPS
jgi:hypothetical protein